MKLYVSNLMPKVFTSKTQKIGELGEKIVAKFLMKRGFSIKDRNYTKKWGEIDIIAEKDNKIHFIEVKSVSVSILPDVSRVTEDNYRPEDNMHPWKAQRMARTVQTYLFSNKISENADWQVDLIAVYLCLKNKKARIKVVKNIIL